MQFTSPALAFIAQSLLVATSIIAFTKADYFDESAQQIIDTLRDNLRFPIDTNGTTALDALESNEIIINGRGTATITFNSLTVVDALVALLTGSAPSNLCADQSFGFDGQYTNTVCNTVDAMINVCTANEPGFDPASFQTIRAGKVLDNPEVAATFLCLANTNFTNNACYDNSPAYFFAMQVVSGLFSLLENIPDGGWDNLMLTNSYGDASRGWEIFGVDASDPNAHWVLGDGYFKLNELVFNDATLESIDAKIYSGIKMVTNQFTKHMTDDFVFSYEGDLYQDILEGYLMQRYASDVFTAEERAMSVDLVQKKSPTEGCGHVIGMLIASECGGYNAEDIEALWTLLPVGEDICSMVNNKHFMKASKAMVKGTNKDAPTHLKCIKKLKLKKQNKKKNQKRRL